MPIHPLQEELLEISKVHNLKEYSFRRIGRELLKHEEHPQKIKHHIEQLKSKGLLKEEGGRLKPAREGMDRAMNLLLIPIFGSVSCGVATAFAEDTIEGYLRVSPSTVSKRKGLFALKASGPSMNRANIGGLAVEEGDYVIVDKLDRQPENGEYIISIIDGCANLKKFVRDESTGRVFLISESDLALPPIVIDAKDEYDYLVAGKVVDIIKTPVLS